MRKTAWAMKTAAEMRAISTSRIQNELDSLQEQILESAKLGKTACTAWLRKDCHVVSDERLRAIVRELKDKGYKASYEVVYDQRDGDAVKFTIKW